MPRVALLRGPSTGGIRQHVNLLMSEAKERGFEPLSIAPSGVGGTPDAVVDVRRVARGSRGERQRLNSVLAECDLVHAHGLAAAAALRRCRPSIPVLVTVHNGLGRKAGRRSTALLIPIARRALKHADVVIGTADDLITQLAPRHKNTHVIFPFGPEVKTPTTRVAARQQLGIDDERLVVVWIGRLQPQKNPKLLLEIGSSWCPQNPTAELFIVGAGPMGREVARGLAEIRAAGGVVGHLDHSDRIADLLSAADVLLCTSVWESGPLVVTEAMANQTAIVSSRVGFVSALLSDGSAGVLCRGSTQFVNALDRLNADRPLLKSMQEAAPARQEAVIDRPRLLDQTFAIYAQLLGGAPAGPVTTSGAE